MAFQLIVISSPKKIPREAEIIISLFKNGMKDFHLRKPGMSKKRMKAFIQKIPVKFHSRIVIHSHYGLAKKMDLKGIYLTEKKRAITGRAGEKYFSTVFHLKNDFMSLRDYDAIFFSPVFASISKPGYGGDVPFRNTVRFVKNYKSEIAPIKMIALGGISEKNILRVKKAGFDGAAVLGAIWNEKDPVKNFLQIRAKIAD